MQSSITAKILNTPALEGKDGILEGAIQIVAHERMDELTVNIHWIMECISPQYTRRVQVGENEIRFIELDAEIASTLPFNVLGNNQPASMKGKEIEIRHLVEVTVNRSPKSNVIASQVFLYLRSPSKEMPQPADMSEFEIINTPRDRRLTIIWNLVAIVLGFFFFPIGLVLPITLIVWQIKHKSKLRKFGSILLKAGETLLIGGQNAPIHIRLIPGRDWVNDTLCLELIQTEYYRWPSSEDRNENLNQNIVVKIEKNLDVLVAKRPAFIQIALPIPVGLEPTVTAGPLDWVLVADKNLKEGDIGVRYTIKAFIKREPKENETISIPLARS